LVEGWQLAPQQEAHAVSQPIYGVHRVERPGGWIVDGWRVALQQEATPGRSPYPEVIWARRGVASCARATPPDTARHPPGRSLTRRSLMRQGDGRQTPPGILKPVLRPPTLPAGRPPDEWRSRPP